MYKSTSKTLLILIPVIAAGVVLAATAISSDNSATVINAGPEREAGSAPMTAGEQELAAIQEDGRIQVRAVTEQLRLTTDPEENLALQRRIVAIKQEARLRFLESLAAYTLRRGDDAVHREALRQIDLIRNPPQPDYGPPSPEALRKMKIARGEQP